MGDQGYLLAMLLLFVAVFIAIEGFYAWWQSRHGAEASRLSKRLRMISAGGEADPNDLSLLKRRLGTNASPIERLLLRIPRLGSLDRFLAQTGTDWSVANYLGISAALFVAVVMAALLLRQPIVLSLLAAAACGIAPTLYLLRCRSRRLTRFETLLPETLDLIGRSLRAGHSLPSALQMAATELPPPISEEFQQTFDEINFGIAAQNALQNLAARVPSQDLGFFVIAVLIQRETGGNLSEILANISTIIRERLKLFGKVRALSAEGRFSGLVLALLPFFTGLMLYTIDSDFMATLWRDPSGLFVLKLGLGFMVVGMYWMRRIVRIRV